MSFTIIEDGKGSGVKAEIDSQNRLQVNARSEPSEESESVVGRSFILHALCYTKAATGGAFLTVTNNDTAFNMHVTRIYIDPYTLTDTDLRITQVFDATISGGTDISLNTDFGIDQKNRSFADRFDLTLKHADASTAMTYTGGVEYHDFKASTQQRNMQGTNILPAGKSITWGWRLEDGNTAVADQIVSFSVNITKIPV